MDGVLSYSEAAFVGYRGHAAGRAPAPRFWFGTGLGYGCWDYLGADVDDSGEAPVVTVSLRNTADVPAGVTAEVTVACDARIWRRWNTSSRRWDRIGGSGELLIARGLGDVRLRLSTPGRVAPR